VEEANHKMQSKKYKKDIRIHKYYHRNKSWQSVADNINIYIYISNAKIEFRAVLSQFYIAMPDLQFKIGASLAGTHPATVSKGPVMLPCSNGDKHCAVGVSRPKSNI